MLLAEQVIPGLHAHATGVGGIALIQKMMLFAPAVLFAVVRVLNGEGGGSSLSRASLTFYRAERAIRRSTPAQSLHVGSGEVGIR